MRWQLTEPHYLNVPGNKWELEIKNRQNGRSERKQFPVPLHLDPNIESDWNYVDKLGNNVIDGKIIVCWEGRGEDKDIIFSGPPTPGMLPLDDEARAESAKFSWTPTQGLDDISQSNAFSQQLLIKFTEELKGVSQAPQIEGMSEFMKTMAAMMQTQTEILAALVGRQTSPLAPAPTPERQPTQEEELARIAAEEGLEPVVDDLPPLPTAPKRPRRM
jgi:hypothetical protein